MATDISPLKSTVGLENDKFATNDNSKVVVRVEDESLSGLGGLLNGVVYDSVSVAYPNGTTEVYSFFTGGLAGTLVATVTLIYSNSSKADLVSGVKT